MMLSRYLVVCVCLLFSAGCIYNDEPMPKIDHDYSSRAFQRRPLLPAKSALHKDENVPASWLPPSHLEKKWSAIVIHHSGTKNGSAAVFDRWHKEGNHWEGIGYDFVIGNGTDSADGQVEATYRWHNQKIGAHCGGTPGNWANKDAIGVCLVGNFNRTIPTARQMEAVTKLVKFLQDRYGIPKSRIYGHNTTPGARPTDCPGRYFSIAELRSK